MGRTEEVSAAIADETEITAIEEAGIIAQSKSAEADDNPADRRLPLIARIYGIVMLVEGVVTLPIIVISCLYAVQAALSGRLAFDALNLTTILSVIHAAVLLVSTELEEILELSDRILVLFGGAVMGILDRAEATLERLGLLMAGARD